MSQLQTKTMTPEEFLAWEATQEPRWEFDGNQPVAMTGGTDAHAAIQVNVIAALKNALRGRHCYARGSEIKIEIGSEYRYPDAFVSCTPVARDSMVATDPVVVFEVLSESTAKADRTTTLKEYCSLSSVQRGILLEQDQAFATIVTRTEAGWSLGMLDASGTLAMPEIGIEVAMSDLYDGLDFTSLE